MKLNLKINAGRPLEQAKQSSFGFTCGRNHEEIF